eukprot:PhF_6_TR8466/c0_g1_i2/m.13223/K06072/DOHH; deoxyhypusine monooxygenase
MEHAAILQSADQPLDARIRALHELREPDCPLTTSEKAMVLQNSVPTTKSVLLLHEIMYALGQIGTEENIDFLASVLVDVTQDVVTRHEAAEALGAVSDVRAITILKQVMATAGTPVELTETCHLAIRRIEDISVHKKAPRHPSADATFSSIDPSPAFLIDNQDARTILQNSTLDLYDRYGAMFYLRNKKDVEGLCAAMTADTSSALFRHEIAFVLGQLE